MRVVTFLLTVLLLTGCNRGSQNKDAVRQGLIDYLSARKDLNISSMDVNVSSVQFTGNRAEATVSFTPKGVAASQGMTMRYQLEQQSGRWVVVGKQDSGHAGSVPPGSANPHEGGVTPDGANPHGNGGVAIPSPEDLPPTGGPK